MPRPVAVEQSYYYSPPKLDGLVKYFYNRISNEGIFKSGAKRGARRTSSGEALSTVNPKLSLISIGSSEGLFMLKPCSNFAITKGKT
uniref:Uncharacterized protein n=1 Tax=Solanum lycopersicum TaxID=4081 RepID=A0A3Q7H2G7_SOLLC